MEFYDKIKTLLDENKIEECKNEFYSFENWQLLEDTCWDLTHLFCELLGKQHDEEALNFLQQAALYLCQQFGNPKELFLIYLENSDSFFKNDSNYYMLIEAVQVLLMRQSTKFVFYSLELAINQLRKNIAKKIDYENIFNLTNKYTDFLANFVDFLLANNDSNMKNLLLYSLVNLFHEPLLNKNLESDEHSELIKKILAQISKLEANFFNLIIRLHTEKQAETDTIKLSNQSLGPFLYSVYKHEPSRFPLIYSGFYQLRVFSPIVNDLINQTKNQYALEKSLIILSIILNKVESKSLDGNILELDDLVELVQLLFKVAVFSEFESVRKQALDVLKLFFDRFNRMGRYWFLIYFLNDNSKNETLNNYASSYLVYLFKEELNECLSSNDPFYNYQFKTRVNFNFKRLFSLITRLNPSTNLMQEASKVMAILNLIRFVLIGDKQNQTGLNELLVAGDYLEELKRLTEATKSSYELEKHTMLNKPQENESGSQLEVKTQNGILNEPSFDEKLQSVKNGLQSIELIESLRLRSLELLNERIQ